MKKRRAISIVLTFCIICLAVLALLFFLRHNEAEIPVNAPVAEEASDTAQEPAFTEEMSSADAKEEEAQVPEEEPTFDIVITMVGDVMLAEYKNEGRANSFNETEEAVGDDYFFAGVQDYFDSDDITIINYEAVMTDQNLPERFKDENPGYWYFSKTANKDILGVSNIQMAGLVNNHTRDYGEEGYADTRNAIESVGITTAGFDHVGYYEVNGFRIALVACRLWVWGQESEGLALYEEAAANSDFQIAYFHGGEMFVYTPDDFKVAGAHAYVDAGFDLVIGSHPHCLQPREIYNDTEIVYSLGNFCYGGTKNPNNRTVMYRYTITVDRETKEVVGESSEIIPCYVFTGESNNYQPAVITDEAEKEAVLEFMDGLRESPY